MPDCWYCARYPCQVSLGVRHCPCVCHLGGDPGPDPVLVAEVPVIGLSIPAYVGMEGFAQVDIEFTGLKARWYHRLWWRVRDILRGIIGCER